MTLKQYLHTTGLSHLFKDVQRKQWNTTVRDAFQKTKEDFTDAEVNSLYIYPVPKIGPGGTCSLTHEVEEVPYNLAHIYQLTVYCSHFDDAPHFAKATRGRQCKLLTTHPVTLRLWRLKYVVHALQKHTGVDWLGIYRRVEKTEGPVLVKESYVGRISRSEFPLTKEFAAHSNNSTVGMTGKGIVIHDIETYTGPYYQCDAEVHSECCLPIFGKNKNVTGIIDAESFHSHFFSPEKILALATVCIDLPRFDPALS